MKWDLPAQANHFQHWKPATSFRGNQTLFAGTTIDEDACFVEYGVNLFI